MKNKFKIISVVLAVSILLQFFTPSIIIAYDLFYNDVQTTKEEVKQPKSPAIKELVDKRQSNIKYFIKDDFTYEAMLYSNDVHYVKDGQYVDINNKLETKRDINDLFIESYENKDNSFKVKFFKKLNNNYIYRLKDDKYEINYDLVGINRGINATKQEHIADDDITTLENIYDGLKYKNVYDNIDLSYLIMPNGVKENIILNTNTNKTEFTYEINVKNLTLSIKDNVIYFTNENNEDIYTLEAPYMYDANNEINTDITLGLLGVDGKYTVTMNISKEWLNSKDRKYPVVIDPVVTSSIARANINDVHVSEGFATTNYYNSYILKTGYGSSSRRNRSFIKFLNLPALQTGDMIINAYLQTSLATYYTTDHQVTVHKVTSNWNQTSVTWNNQPTYDPKVIDYDTITGSQYSIQSWNITAIAKEWYNTGLNNGLMIKNYNEAANYNEYYSADVVESLQTYRPVAVFQYINNTGLENYWTYHSQNIGRAGTIYTNDYNGNLILKHFDASTTGNRLPVSINHVYNTNDANDINGLPINIGYGNGFRLNLSQTISSELINQVQYYKYIDEDGTRQYFYQSGSVYVDENGLGLELSLSNNIFTMKDKGGNTSTFESYNGYWRLKTIKDSNNNIITINYNGNFISSVVDPTGDTITLTYTNNLLTSIKDANNKTTSYSYTNNNLSTITYPDSKYSSYTYDSRYLLTSAKNIDNSHLDYTYSTNTPYRVNNIKEYSTLNELGNTLSMDYSENTTQFTDNNNSSNTYVFNNAGHTISIMDYGKNGTINDAYGQNYSYGTSGNIKNKITLESNLNKPVVNNLLNGNAEYDGDWGTANWGFSPGTMSYTTEASYYGARSFKLTVPNAGSYLPLFYQSVNLTKGKMYTVSAYIKTLDVLNTVENNGAVLFTQYYNSQGQFIINYSSGLRGNNDWTKHSYTFTYPTDIVGNLAIGIGLRDSKGIVYFDAIQLEEGSVANNFNFVENSNFDKGSLKWYANGYINTTLDKVITVDTNNNLMKITGEPTKDKHYSQNINISGNAGDVFTFGGIARSFGVPYYENRVSDITIGILNDDNTWQVISKSILPDSNRWQYVSKEFVTEKKYKNIVVYLLTYKNANEVFFDNIMLHKDESGNSYAYDANGNLVNAKDSAKQNTLTSYDNKNQLISTLLPSGSKLNYEYDYNYKNRLLSATSKDGLSFNFTYDAYGNATSTKVSESSLASSIDVNQIYYIKAVPSNLYIGVNGSVNTNGSNIELMALGTNGNQEWKFNDLGNGYYNLKPAYTTINAFMEVMEGRTANSTNIQIWSSHGGDHEKFKLVKNDDGSYTFKPKHLETSCVDISGASYAVGTNIFQYQCHGGINQKFYIIKKDTSNNKYIETNQEYSTNGDYLTKLKDALGNVVIYNYNIDGTLNNVVDSKNKVTNYIYDNMGRITNISKSGYSNSYSYTNDNLSSITHNGFNYNFIYDTFGNTKQVKVNDKVLITNNYASSNGNLLNSLYGNNQSVSYEYDTFNRVIKKTTGNNIYEYMYDNKGNLAVTKDNNNTYTYSYDLADRLLKVNNNNYNISYKYGANSNISNIDYKYLNNTNSVSYSYDTLARISSVANGNSTINYNYDLLSRLNNKVLTVGNNTYPNNYSYITNNNKTSIILGSITNGSNILSYTYDLNGNIETILDNNIEISRYYYDDLNQLIKEDNAYLNQTITYNYDLGGNILYKTIYEYKTTNLLDTINYTYDTNWKDQLLSYDNKQITYDQIGNPLTYDTYTYEWINGRQLSKIIDNTNTYQYKYNDSGIREEKIINGVSTKYYLEGSKIIYQTNGTNIIYYMYDETGNILGLKYNSNEYYYIKNAQNDIIGLLDSNLNKIVNYKYDSWGSIISITDNNGVDISNDPSHIGNNNPYRYRSYYYDIESNLYYLQSRYYNPTWGRFMNADGYVTTGTGILGNNMYAYANNNPIMYIDPSGHFPKWLKNIGNSITKTMTTFIKKSVNAIVDGFIFEIGAGEGAGINISIMNVDTSISTYQDVTWGIKKGKTYTNTIGGTSANILGFGASYELSHNYPFDPNESGWKHTAFDLQVISNCKLTEKKFGVNTPLSSFTNGNIFIGIELEAHAIVGGHIKIGWEINY